MEKKEEGGVKDDVMSWQFAKKKKKKVKELIEENKHTNYRVIRFFYKVYWIGEEVEEINVQLGY